jgi:hypothetical protein
MTASATEDHDPLSVDLVGLTPTESTLDAARP